MGLKKLKKQPDRLEHAELADISNVGDAGGTVARDSKKIVTNIANQLWHSDSSFPAAGGALFDCWPAGAGPLEWVATPSSPICAPPMMACLRTWKDEIEGLEAEHYCAPFPLPAGRYRLHRGAEAGPAAGLVAAGAHTSGLGPQAAVRRHPCALHQGLDGGRGPHAADGHAGGTPRSRNSSTPTNGGPTTSSSGTIAQRSNRGRRFDLSQPRELRRATTLDVDTNERAAA